MVLGGSTARGNADRYSDIDVGVFWQRPPTDEERRTAATAVPGDLQRLYPYDAAEQVWCDDFFLGHAQTNAPKSGVLLEISHYTCDLFERTLDNILIHYDTNLLKQNLIAGVVQSVALHNAQLINGWKERAADYPDGLRLAVVKRHAQIDHFWRWQMLLARDRNLLLLYDSFVQIQYKLLHTLLALNRVYYFGFKRLSYVDQQLVIKPPSLLQQLRRVYEVDPPDGAQLLTTLVEQTYDLVERELPGIDVARLRTIFRYRRPQWEQAPPRP